MDEQGRYDYDYVVQWLRERDRLPDGFEQIERGEYDALDAALHAEYEASLLMIKRRLKLEPDCKDTIWDRDYRHPIDIRKTIEEIFARCAPRAAQGGLHDRYALNIFDCERKCIATHNGHMQRFDRAERESE